MRRIITVFMALSVLLCAHALCETAQEGSPAPDFEITTLSGETFRLSEQRGKVVFLNFWATWCPPCEAELPDIQAFYTAHPEDVALLGISVEKDAATVAAFAQDHGVTYPIALDADYALAQGAYPCQFIPMSVFIGPNGTVRFMDVGMLDLEEMESLYQDALTNG